jgi:hypothetical protein
MKSIGVAIVAATVVAAFAAAGEASASRGLCVGGGGCYPTIQAAVDAARDGDVVTSGAGTFAGGVVVDTSIELIGAGPGATIISGGGPVLTIGIAGATTEPTVTIEGVTVTGGTTIGNLAPSVARGGGAYIPRAAGPATGATVTIRNSVITGNHVAPAEAVDDNASAGGGGISNDGNLTLENVVVTANHADASDGLTSEADGGGILNRAFGNLTMRASVVSGNDARVVGPNGREADGGGMLAVAGTLSIADSVVSGNTVSASATTSDEVKAHAGGLHSEAGVMATIRSSTFSGNTATAENTLGNAMAFCGGVCTDGDVDIRDVAFDHNRVVATTPAGDASVDSGGLGVGCCENPPTLVTIRGSSFTANSVEADAAAGTATAAAGAVSMANLPAVDLRDSLVRGNSANATSTSGTAVVHGGGLASGGELELRGTTVSDNVGRAFAPTGEAQGGGIWNGAFGPPPPAPELTLIDTTVTGNSLDASFGVSVHGGGIFTTVPITLQGTIVAANSPDQCFGC